MTIEAARAILAMDAVTEPRRDAAADTQHSKAVCSEMPVITMECPGRTTVRANSSDTPPQSTTAAKT